MKRWKETFLKKIKSKEVSCDPQVWSSGKDFKKYFKNIFDINISLDYETIQTKGDYKYVLWVSVKEQDFMIMVCSKLENKCVLKVKTIEDHLEMAKFVLNTFIFLFSVQT